MTSDAGEAPRRWLVARDQARDRVALLEEGRLVEYYEEIRTLRIRQGSIVSGIVRDVVPAITAAFVEIGSGEKAFLQAETPAGLPHPGDRVLVQLVSEARGTKAPQISRDIKLPGRLVVLVPGSDHLGVSKKISDVGQREALRAALESQRERLRAERAGQSFGLIARSRAAAAEAGETGAELRALVRLWDQIAADFERCGAPLQLYEELPLPLRLLRDRVEDGDQLTIDSKTLLDEMNAALQAPSGLAPRLFVEGATGGLFEQTGVEEQLREAFARCVTLPGGGSIVIDHTEALVAIDVNSGSNTNGGALEETAIQINRAAAHEAARQMRLRNLGGIIIIDFIEMRDPAHRDELMRAFERDLARDPARIRLLPLDEFGLAKLTRKKQ